MKARIVTVVMAVVGVVLCSCATQPSPEALSPPGFWSGLLHGLLIFFSLVGSLFTDVRVYAFPNSGFFYDLGFFLGAAAILGGGGRGVRRRR